MGWHRIKIAAVLVFGALALGRMIGAATGSGVGHIYFVWDVPPWAEAMDAGLRATGWWLYAWWVMR